MKVTHYWDEVVIEGTPEECERFTKLVREAAWPVGALLPEPVSYPRELREWPEPVAAVVYSNGTRALVPAVDLQWPAVTVDYSELEARALTQLYRDRCCERATLAGPCVCDFVTQCPEHGEKHHGTHD